MFITEFTTAPIVSTLSQIMYITAVYFRAGQNAVPDENICGPRSP